MMALITRSARRHTPLWTNTTTQVTLRNGCQFVRAFNESWTAMTDPQPTTFTRRTLLLAVGVGLVATSCGNDTDKGTRADDDMGLVRQFADPSITVGTNRRLAIVTADLDGVLRLDVPPTLDAELSGPDGRIIGTITGKRRQELLTRPSYEFRVDVPVAGTYSLSAGRQADAAFTVVEPGTLPFPGPGDPLPGYDTATPDAPGDVNPICTRDPICEFHDITLTAALAQGRPVAYLVGTPAHCSTGICGPVLDVLRDVRTAQPDIIFVHTEVYKDDAAVEVAPAVTALGVDFEPVIFLAGSDGIIVERLDIIFDKSELLEHLDRLI